ncbi:MAG: hypothetical protein N2510_00005, partial [Ignavibacteria bacterium]|nr:hypothetical protein [Ignavibacteria bacterium]
SLKNYLQENYNIISENLILSNQVQKKKKGKTGILNLLSDYFEKFYLRNPSQLASYGLMKAMLRKDKTLRASIFPVMILPAALALFGLITDQLPDPFYKGYLQSKPVFHISILLSVIVVLNTSLLGVRTSNNPEASWIYGAFPMREIADFISGIRKFFSLNFVLPVTLSVLIITLFSIEFWHAAINFFFILSSAILYNSVFFSFSRQLPFTEENSTINSMKRFASLVNPFIFGIFMVIVQSLVYHNLLITVITIIIMLIATYLINISARHFLRKASFNLSAHLK